MKAQTRLRSGLIIAALFGATLPALADCPALPDGPDSANVANTQQRALCLQQQLHDNTVNRNNQTQFDGLKSTIQQQQIQRRFDNLPRIGPRPPWER